MGFVYHGSKEHGLKKLEPRKSTHGTYVYATTDKVLALNFSKRCGDDLVYTIGHFNTDKNGPWEIVELIPGAFEKMYANDSSIYTLSDETFKDIHTGFQEVVSEVEVDVINEEFYESVYDALLKAEEEGLVNMYRYPNRPQNMKSNKDDIFDKWRFYRNTLKQEFSKKRFDRLVYLHPDLLNEINELSKELGYDYFYKVEDLVGIFKLRIEMQLVDPEQEQYVDCSYKSICNTFPLLKSEIDVLYENYKRAITDTLKHGRSIK